MDLLVSSLYCRCQFRRSCEGDIKAKAEENGRADKQSLFLTSVARQP